MNDRPSFFLGEVSDIMSQFSADKRAYLERLQLLPSERVVIKREELDTIRAITDFLTDYLKDFETKGITTEQAISEIIEQLDGWEDFWASKFTTESQGTGEDLQETPVDSIYYMAKVGSSLRLKMANLEQGLKKVIQPFAEFIYFTKPGAESSSEVPVLGYNTEEYFSKVFTNLITSNESPSEDYQSSIKKYYKNGHFYDAPKTDNVTFHHNGSPVNKIFWSEK